MGGAAGVLCRWLDRTTGDIDVAVAHPRLAEFQIPIVEVAEKLGLPENWLNDGAKAFAEVLPPDFQSRLVLVGNFGKLRVTSISRKDLILLKFYGFRAEDFGDLKKLAPTEDEIAFVRGELVRIATFNEKRAHQIELYLAQGDSNE